MEVDTCVACVVCRVAYSTEQELEEHNWSLMHHIKIEQTKKGSPHSCSLCMETCANIIEYGKHLNEDKHKIALSRLSQAGPEQMLNSLDPVPQKGQSDFQQRMDKNRGQNMHTRSQSQPVELIDLDAQPTEKFKHPRNVNNKSKKSERLKNRYSNTQKSDAWQSWDELRAADMGRDLRGNGWNSTADQGQGWQQNHGSRFYDNYNGQDCFYNDNYGMDWSNNQFYSENYDIASGWGTGAYYGRNRRGSFDESFMGRQSAAVERKGRGKQRGRGHTRTSSYDPHKTHSNYDNYSPESNSSTDSNGLKRRLEDGEPGAPEKSRRRNDRNSHGRYNHGNKHMNTQNELLHDRSNRMSSGNSRSTSRERMSQSEYDGSNTRNSGKSRSTSRERMSQNEQSRTRSRSSSQNSNRRVTWSDQQDVTSTSDLDTKALGDNGRSSSLSRLNKKTEPVTAVPDSSTESKKSKKKGGKKSPTKKSGHVAEVSSATEGRVGDKTAGKDSTESVLEKAENLCKKLRNERKKIKQQKLSQEKQKKFEKTEELNTQIAELSKENMKKITGRLETLETVTMKDGEKLLDSQGPMSSSTHKLGADKSAVSGTVSTQNTDQHVQPSTPKSTNTSGDPKIAERIAQTRADIDAIRAKIEGSVQAEKVRPGFKSPPLLRSPVTLSGKPDNNSLLKMVNAPRTTRERLHVAQLLRNHAKSQTKFSLPRFNLKMSDLVENQPELEDLSQFSIEALDPSVQLEIANLIEADIKPDVAELQILLDAASSQNAELDSNILSDLGISQSPSRLNAPADNVMPNSPLTVGHNSRRDHQNVPNIGMPERSSSPNAARKQAGFDIDNMDDKPSLSVEELVTEVNKAKEHLLGVRERDRQNNLQHHTNTLTSHFSSSLPLSSTDHNKVERLASSVRDTSARFEPVRVKQELEDDGYNFALSSSGNQHKSSGVEPATFNRDSGLALSSNTVSSNSTIKRAAHQSSPNRENSSRLEPRIQDAPSSSTAPSVSTFPGSVHKSVHTIGSQAAASTVHRSVHTRQFYPSSDEMPVRDTDKPASPVPQNTADSTVDRVNAILNAVPNMDNVLTSQPETMDTSGHTPSKGDTRSSETAGLRLDSVINKGDTMHGENMDQRNGNELTKPTTFPDESLHLNLEEKDKQFNTSVNSNTSSVLDQVYTICVEEENIRTEINTVDAKINKLKSLISEAQQQLNTFTDRRKELTTKETHFRSSRMKLLHESRSQQGSSGSQSEGLPGLVPNLADTNPMMLKFLMSQRQSDLSSVGGYSNVESGSQPDDGQHSVRRGSRDSGQSDHGEPAANQPITAKRNQNMLFSQSIDILTGSTDTLTSLKSQELAGNRNIQEHGGKFESLGHAGNQGRDSGTPIPVDTKRKNVESSVNNNPDSNSISLLKHPLDNFVTLDALLKGDTEIGKLIHKSLESIQKGEVRQQEEVVIKSPDTSDDPFRTRNGSKGIVSGGRDRRSSGLSVGSEDMCVSGSDTEKLTGKVSMKYMGTLPDGVNYESYKSIMKQVSSGGKDNVMVTVLNSPEPVVSGKTESNNNRINEHPLAKASVADINKKAIVADFSLMFDKSPRSDTTSTISADLHEMESLSARSNFSLGEKIKRMCDVQNMEGTNNVILLTPRSESSGEKTLEDEPTLAVKTDGTEDVVIKNLPITSPKTVIERMTSPDSSSPSRKKLKSKRERDQKSRRKQKENFILLSDTNSEVEEGSQSSSLQNSSLMKSTKSTSKSEEDLVLTGSEDCRRPQHQSGLVPVMKRSLLDEVQLETETLSESGEDKSSKLTKQNELKRFTIEPGNLEKFRNNVKKLNPTPDPTSIEYAGPPLSVMAIQIFKGDVYVCYNGSNIRRFQLKTGKILRELESSPYLLSCLHVTSVVERGDILYAAGPCKKLLLFDPMTFNSIGTLPYMDRIVCLHEDWGRLFVGLDDGTVSVLSLKTDKVLNTFSCSACSISCIESASAGMTKMLCLGMADKIIYILDAITGLLITMLEGHTLAPLCIQVFGEKIISSSADNTILIHHVTSGSLLKVICTNKPLFQIWTDGTSMYAAGHDKTILMYNQEFKLSKIHRTEEIVMFVTVNDGRLFVGYRNGMVEAIPISDLGKNNSDKVSIK